MVVCYKQCKFCMIVKDSVVCERYGPVARKNIEWKATLEEVKKMCFFAARKIPELDRILGLE